MSSVTDICVVSMDNHQAGLLGEKRQEYHMLGASVLLTETLPWPFQCSYVSIFRVRTM
jgi:hypothetical protein